MAVTCVAVPLGPACANITGVRGGDRNIMTVRITSNGLPVNLTGKTLTAQARKTPLDTSALDAVVTVTDALDGRVELRWPGAQVATLLGTKKSWTGVWDLQIAEPGLDPLTVAAGTFAAEMDVTRP